VRTSKVLTPVVREAIGVFSSDTSSPDAAADAVTASRSPLHENQTLYRVHGGKARPLGTSWTPQNPAKLLDPRNDLGLPDSNSGEFVSRATVLNEDGVEKVVALPLDGNKGGAPEWKFPNPNLQLQIDSTMEVHPPY
jgi:hypothetical protein